MIEPQSSSEETLNETIARAAESWHKDDIVTIVAGLRTQRDKWNLEQAKGSKKRVTSKKITPPKSAVRNLVKGLGKLTL